MGLFDGQTVVVTGGASGIGAATCRAFAAQGARVAVVDIDAGGASAVAEEIGDGASAYTADVRSADDVRAVAGAVVDGHGAVDVLVNNAGHWVKVQPFHQSQPEDWDAILAVNLRQVLLVTHAFLGPMLQRGKGVIVNVTSIEGLRAYPRDPVYGAAKAAVAHFTGSMAVAYGRKGIRVVGIAPDITNTAQVPYDEAEQGDPRWSWWAPVGRFGTPEDNADVIVALASEQFRFVTGMVVPTDGGTGVAGGWFYADHRRTFVNRPDGLSQ